MRFGVHLGVDCGIRFEEFAIGIERCSGWSGVVNLRLRASSGSFEQSIRPERKIPQFMFEEENGGKDEVLGIQERRLPEFSEEAMWEG